MSLGSAYSGGGEGMYDDGLAVLGSECFVIDFVIVVIGDLSFVGHVVDVGRSLGRSGGNVVDVVSLLLLLLMVTLVGLLILLTTRENSYWTNVRS